MSKAMLFRTMAVVVLAAVAVFSLISCGDDSETAPIIPITNTNTAMTQAEATTFVMQLFDGVAQGTGFKPQSQQKVLEATTSVNSTYNCTSGGTIGISGSVTVPDSGNGTATVNLTETITNWKCISSYTVNGSVAVNASFNMSGGNVTSYTMNMSGSVSTQSASCAISVSATSNNGNTATLAGIACGQTISGTI